MSILGDLGKAGLLLPPFLNGMLYLTNPLKGGTMFNKESLDHLWFVMHHSDDPKRVTMVVTCYLDESGTDEQSSQAVVAGLIMHRDQFLLYDALWEDMLLRHNITPPLHMKEFGKHGRHGHLTYDKKFELFTDVANFINVHKVVSVGATLNHKQYINLIHDKMKRHIGLYGVCFMLCAHVCFAEAWTNNYTGDLAFVMEAGNQHAEHVRQAHQGMMEMKNKTAIWINTGTLTFAPKDLSVLQAADVIAWGVNRRSGTKGLGKGFQPIAKIFNNMHIQLPWPDEVLKEWSDSVMERRAPNFDV
jgi:hypothetical protein